MLRDPVSSASHLLFAVWAVYAFLILRRLSPKAHLVPASIFGLSMILLYAASGLFHGLPFTKADNPVEFRFFQRIDQSAILLLIAGTNTPLIMALLNGGWRRWCLLGMWTFALAGVACLWVLPKAPHQVIVVICLAMGWIGLLPAPRYYRAVGWKAMNWALLGCTLYTLGALCELTERPVIWVSPVRVGFHEVFHVLCAGASFAFFVFVTRYVITYQPTLMEGTRTPSPSHRPRRVGVARPVAKRSFKTT